MRVTLLGGIPFALWHIGTNVLLFAVVGTPLVGRFAHYRLRLYLVALRVFERRGAGHEPGRAELAYSGLFDLPCWWSEAGLPGFSYGVPLANGLPWVLAGTCHRVAGR